MRMMQCPNCGKFSGFKRALGFGTFFMVLLSCGLWLLIIPFYPARCIHCGLTRHTAVTTNFISWLRQLNTRSKAIPIGAPILFLVGVSVLNSFEKVPSAAPQISKISSSAPNNSQVPNSVPDVQPTQSENTSEDHGLHLVPNVFGEGAISDGRTYSIALISTYQTQIPPATKLFVQGMILGQTGPDAVILSDERNPEKTLVCGMTPEEFHDVVYLYPAGSRVRAYGIYENAAASVPFLRNCTFSSPTDKVVRPEPVQTVNTESRPGEGSAQDTESSEFRWQTDGLPAEIADALNTPDLAPNTPGASTEVSLEISGQKQILSLANDCGSGGCSWDLSDATTRRYLLQFGLGKLHKAQNVTAGYYDLLLEAKDVLVLYQYRGESYRETKCYSRSDGLGSPAILTPCSRK